MDWACSKLRLIASASGSSNWPSTSAAEVLGGGTQVGLFMGEGFAPGLRIRAGLVRRPLLPARLAYDLRLPLDHLGELLKRVIARPFRSARQLLGFLRGSGNNSMK